jgi:DNA-binding transcriptional LysR family regulator
MLEFKQLSYFIAAYEERSITSAASRCFITQPSITHAIKGLENKLNSILFLRSRQGLTPTEQGHTLYKKVKVLLQQNLQIEQSFIDVKVQVIKLYLQHDLRLSRYNLLFKLLREQQSAIEFSLVDNIEQADIAIMEFERVPSHYNYQVLEQENYYLVVPTNHQLAGHVSVNISDLDKLNIIQRPYCSQRKVFERLLKSHQVEINIVAKAHHDQQLLDMVEVGFGVGIIPNLRNENNNSIVRIPISLEQKINRTTVFAYRLNQPILNQIITSLNFDFIRSKLYL